VVETLMMTRTLTKNDIEVLRNVADPVLEIADAKLAQEVRTDDAVEMIDRILVKENVDVILDLLDASLLDELNAESLNYWIRLLLDIFMMAK